MITAIKKLYRRSFAGLMLLTVEMLMLIALFIVAFTAFLFITKTIFWDKADTFDLNAFRFMEVYVSDSSTNFMILMSALGSYQFLILANALLTSYFLFRRRKWYSIKIPAISLSSVTVMLLLKEWFKRPRPLTPLLEPAYGLSFPSGHAMGAVTFYGLLIYFLFKTKMNAYLRIVLIIPLALLIVMIGLSRIYLRVHYASDVIGGFCAGIIWLIISIVIINRVEVYSKRKLNPIVEDVSKS